MMRLPFQLSATTSDGRDIQRRIFSTSRPGVLDCGCDLITFVKLVKFVVATWLQYAWLQKGLHPMTIQGKQVRLGTPQTKVADMTAGELQTMIEALIDRKMSEWIGDPDVGLDTPGDHRQH